MPIFRSDTTAPPFCARPVWSSARTCRPSAAAAVARICAIVTTPVPPTPVMRKAKPSASNDAAGSSGASTGATCPVRGRAAAGAAGVMLRKDGQSPARQEKSRLQEDWLIPVLRPNSVATGCTDRQLDLAPQSPHPSHTRSLMNTRSAGACALPRRRLRRFSAAHSWSCTRTVTPSIAASSRCTSSRSARCLTSAPRPSWRRSRAGSSVVTTTLRTPSAASRASSRSTGSSPIACWPPVIATAELRSSLNVMLTPAATAARIARLPEWVKVPSPMFCTKCFWATNGARPIHCAPSPPICDSPVTEPTCASGISRTIAWQPIPPPTSVPGATLVEELCGQPEQK